MNLFWGDARRFKPKKSFDKVLIDAPCTSTGTIPKNPDIKVKLTPEEVINYSNLQYQILTHILQISDRDVEITYATCSIFPEENELLISRIIRENTNRLTLHIPKIGSESLIRGIGKRFWPHIHDTIGIFYTGIKIEK